MGRVKEGRKKSGSRSGGIRRRWLVNTFGIMCALGLICVLIVTAVFAAYYYASLETELRNHAETTEEFLTGVPGQSYEEYYRSCISCVASLTGQTSVELQFIGTDGRVIAASVEGRQGAVPDTEDVHKALESREIAKYTGRDPLSQEYAMSICAPVFHGDKLIGVMRYVSPTWEVTKQIFMVGAIALLALAAVMLIVLLSSHYYFRSILIPLQAIVEKAKKITSGSYGIQIETAYNDEIGELADTINEMSIKINENEKMQTEFISSLSHELRTPLTAITGWSETLLSTDDLDPQTRRGMKIIHKEAGRLTEMVLDLLDFTRIQDGRMTLNIELADIRSEYEDVVYMYGSRLSEDGIVLDYQENDQEIPEISCDPKRMRQVFLNILDNAAKHGSEGKRIETSIACEKDTVVVRIRDYGSGIPKDELPLVKKKFYKGSSKARGSGIGLAVCDEIVSMHGGELILENAPGGGTLVTVVLPVSQ